MNNQSIIIKQPLKGRSEKARGRFNAVRLKGRDRTLVMRLSKTLKLFCTGAVSG